MQMHQLPVKNIIKDAYLSHTMTIRARLQAALHSTDRHSCQSKGDGASVAISAVWQRQAAGAEPVPFRLMM